MYLGLGSNVGDRRRHLSAALAAVAGFTRIEAISSVYESEPVGYADQPAFWNLALRVRTTLDPTTLLAALKGAEQQLGRTPTFRFGPRVIDIDILLWNNAHMSGPPVEIPHARMMQRAFVLQPLVELDPELHHPVTGESLADALRAGQFEHITRLFGGERLMEHQE